MIERIVLDGEDVELGDVFASVTIRHGRSSADDGPLASTASLTLVNVERSLVFAFEVATWLELYLAGDVPRFRGRVTDATITELDGGGALSVVAVSSLSWLAARPIGAGDWPAESWSERLARVFLEAGYATTWTTFGATVWEDVDPAATWAAPVDEPPVTVEIGDADPDLAARPAEPTTLGQYLAELAETEPAAIANLPNGNVLVQALTARRELATIELDPLAVAWAPEWSMVDDVENAVTVEWELGAELAESYRSIQRFEPRPNTITTSLANETDAAILAALRITRRSSPEWRVETAELLELDAAIGIGSPVVLSELPRWAPADSYLGMVEGWEDRIEPGDDGELEWTMAIALSAPRISGFGILWRDVDPATSWADVDPAATWFSPAL